MLLAAFIIPTTVAVVALFLHSYSITCRMLINHTNGIDFDRPDYREVDQQRIVDAIAECATLTQVHAPGEATAYSNIGTVIAGHIAQTLRGRRTAYSMPG